MFYCTYLLCFRLVSFFYYDVTGCFDSFVNKLIDWILTVCVCGHSTAMPAMCNRSCPSVRLLLVLILNQLIFDLNFLQVTTIARWKLKVKVTGQGHSSTSNLCQQHRPIKNKPETFKSLTTVFLLNFTVEPSCTYSQR